jgi:Arc/MetJ-type ribon-helix-helix transcriptional regulator
MKTVQARLDEESEQALRHLTRQLGWSPSRVVREGLRLMAKHHGAQRAKKRKIIGMGEFSGGPSDLATNKKHMEDYGR